MEKLNAIVFNIDIVSSRCPVLTLENSISCLIDTGAFMTVVNRDVADYLGQHFFESEAPLKGFGGSGKVTPIHYYKTFTIKQGNTALQLMDTLAYVSDYDKYDVVLSPYFLYDRDIAFSRLHRFIVNGGNIVECNYVRGRLAKHYDDNDAMLSQLTQFSQF